MRVDHVDLDHGLLVIVGDGELRYSDFVSLWDDIRTRAEWGSLRKLFDLTRCTALLWTDDVHHLIDREHQEAHLFPSRRVAVVSAVAVTYGMARMFQMGGESDRRYELEVFRSLEEAKAWLQGGDTA